MDNSHGIMQKQKCKCKKHNKHDHKPHDFKYDKNNLSLDDKLKFCGRYIKHSKCNKNSQENILKILLEKGSIPQKELKDLLNIKGGSLSELISKLVNKNLVTQEKSDIDNRIFILSLTDVGINKAKEISNNKNKIDIFKSLNKEQKIQFNSILDILLDDWYGDND